MSLVFELLEFSKIFGIFTLQSIICIVNKLDTEGFRECEIRIFNQFFYDEYAGKNHSNLLSCIVLFGTQNKNLIVFPTRMR